VIDMTQLNAKSSLLAGALAAVGASLCCLVPLALVALGVGGAWISSLTALAPLRPVFVILSLLFIALAYRKLYLSPQVCAPDRPCDDTGVIKRQRLTFWVVAALSLVLLAGPWFAPLFY
jgi:mercuric ion transport protein